MPEYIRQNKRRAMAYEGEHEMMANSTNWRPGGPPTGRRSRQPARRSRRVEFSLTDTEFEELGAAAARAGLARGAYAAEAALSVARGKSCPADSPFREALGEFIRAAGLVRRIGVNLNQAVAKLNTTGQRSGDLLPYAAACLRRAERLDTAAEEIRKCLP